MADEEFGVADEGPFDPGFLRRGIASAGALLLALLLVALVLWVASSNRERDAASALERRSFEIVLLTRNIDAAIGQSESALGRYVINSDRALGTIYQERWRRAGRLIDELDRLARDNPEQSALVAQLRDAYTERGRELANTANYAAVRRNWEALSLHNQDGASPTGGQISRALDQIGAIGREMLEQRSADRRASTELSNLLANLLAAAGVLFAIGAIVLGWTASRAIGGRLRARQRADTLEAAVAARTAELEQANADLRAEGAERAAAEEKLRQIQKMEAVGQLTGGIAHDFNNMLAVVVGGLDLARRKLASSPEDAGHHIDNALDGANRAAALTRRLLAFARAEPLLPEGTDPVALIEGMHDLIERTIGERIAVTVAGHDGVWPIWVDPHQLENAVLNLALNARDAMDGAGTLTIDVRNVTLGDNEIGEAQAGDYIRIAVSDTGCGMTPEVIDRVFEPFFTTKPVGKGTGLGLSQIFGFARQSGGDIEIKSKPDRGATVALYLPRFDGDATIRKRGADIAAPLTRPGDEAGLVILIVEDDDRVRRATVGAIEELGHVPIACASGEAAEEVFAERDDIGLVLTDVLMPGMTGPELIDRIAPLRPELAVIYVTGYVGDAGEAEQFAGREVLRKPFTITALAESIGAARDRAASGSPPEATAAAAE